MQYGNNMYGMNPYYGTPGAMQMGGYNSYGPFQPQNGQDYNSILQYMMQQNRPPEAPIASLTRGIPAAYYQFQGQNLGPQQATLGQMQNLADAQVNLDNPMYQRIYGQEKDAANQDLASSIAEMSRQNRKLSMLGRAPLFSPERGGEQMFRATTQGYQDAQNNARNRARQILGAGQQAMGQNFAAQGHIAQGKLQNNAMKAGGFGSIADTLGSLMKFGLKF